MLKIAGIRITPSRIKKINTSNAFAAQEFLH
jgi:hypothetical protein